VHSRLRGPGRAERTADARVGDGQARRLTGYGVSQQASAIAGKNLEAWRWRPQASSPVWAVHTEVSFAALLGLAPAPKRT